VYIIFLGPPGAGKGTQAERVSASLGLVHLAPGDLFRQAVKSGDKLGSKVSSYMERGELVPDDITIKVILKKLERSGSAKGVILDGFPRNYIQAKALDEALRLKDKTIDRVIYIEVDKDELVRRLSNRWLCRDCQTPYSSKPGEVVRDCAACGGVLYQRPDDKPETVRRRLEVYFAETAPLIEYYRNQHKLVEVDGEGKVEEITSRIIGALN
jgi:adenylate kinase